MATINERRRHELYVALEERIGAEPTETLMSLLPPVGWADVATKHDIAHLDSLLTARIEGLRTELITRMDSQSNELNNKIDSQSNELNNKIDGLRTELVTRMDSQSNELKAYFEWGLRSTMRTLFFSIGSLIVAMTSILLVAT